MCTPALKNQDFCATNRQKNTSEQKNLRTCDLRIGIFGYRCKEITALHLFLDANIQDAQTKCTYISPWCEDEGDMLGLVGATIPWVTLEGNLLASIVGQFFWPMVRRGGGIFRTQSATQGISMYETGGRGEDFLYFFRHVTLPPAQALPPPTQEQVLVCGFDYCPQKSK